MKKTWIVAFGLAALLIFTLFGSAWAGSSSHYAINWQALSGSGGRSETTSGVTLNAILGQTAGGLSSSDGYGLSAGYLYGGGSQNMRAFFPRLTNNYTLPAPRPDLTVKRIILSSNYIKVVVENIGDAPVAANNDFWVDLYINPSHKPVYNETWETLGSQGGVWGVTDPFLPLEPGEVITLTTGGSLYWPELSNIQWPLDSETTYFYAQVDSANAATAYGAVQESDENNNVSMAILRAGRGSESLSAAEGGLELSISRTAMPARP
jgi:hypothetical protein